MRFGSVGRVYCRDCFPGRAGVLHYCLVCRPAFGPDSRKPVNTYPFNKLASNFLFIVTQRMSYRWPKVRTVALDLEGTGIDVQRERIIQYAIWGVDEDNSVIDVNDVVDPETSTGRDPASIHGIDPKEMERIQPFQYHTERISRVLDGAVVVIHNSGFDWRFLCKEFRRVGAKLPTPLDVRCTLGLASRLRIPTPHTLVALCQTYNIPLAIAHNAVHDARATFWLYVCMANLGWDKGFATTIKEWSRWKTCSKCWFPPMLGLRPWLWYKPTRRRPPNTEKCDMLSKFAYDVIQPCKSLSRR